MAFGKIKPRAVSKEHLQAVAEQAKAQKFYQSVPKSTDPENFPVFTLGEDSYLVYVPNHVVLNDEGQEELRMDKPFLYSIQDGNQYLKIRSTVDIEDEEMGLDGSDPLAEAFQIVTELAQKEAGRALVAQGFSEDDQSDEARKVTSPIFQNRIIKQKQRYYTFPIVVFERTVEEKGNRKYYKLSLDEDGNPKYQVMWYTVSEYTYGDTGKWKHELDRRSEEFEEDFQTPAGLWFKIDGTYALKPNEKWSARDAARKFSITMVNPPKELDDDQVDQLVEELDKITEEWSPEKAIETVIQNQMLPVEDLRVEVDRLVQPIKDKLDLFALGGGSEVPTIGTTAPKRGQDALASLEDDDIDDEE